MLEEKTKRCVSFPSCFVLVLVSVKQEYHSVDDEEWWFCYLLLVRLVAWHHRNRKVKQVSWFTLLREEISRKAQGYAPRKCPFQFWVLLLLFCAGKRNRRGVDRKRENLSGYLEEEWALQAEGIGNLPFLLSVESLSKRREKDVNVLRR